MSNERTTKLVSEVLEQLGGNSLFRGASIALGLQGNTARLLLYQVLKAAGSSPDQVTPEELAPLLPEIEVMVRKLLPPELAQERMQNLQRFMLQIYPDE